MKSWLAQGSSGRWVTLLPGTTFLHINGALDLTVYFHTVTTRSGPVQCDDVWCGFFDKTRTWRFKHNALWPANIAYHLSLIGNLIYSRLCTYMQQPGAQSGIVTLKMLNECNFRSHNNLGLSISYSECLYQGSSDEDTRCQLFREWIAHPLDTVFTCV